MKRLALGLVAVLLAGGCSDSGKQDPLEKAESATSHTLAVASLDAEKLLASTLELAKSQDKRVLVHLGAVW